ncbi:MAG: sugar phosphate isomerase/epimerase family protein, partial [Desulforhabdus sp.]|nr:sugar phosphate isomerase/epimerase family protein [Desulforhabdus sp.]
MKFSFSANAFTRYSLFEAIKIVTSLGYEGIEIMADVPHAFPLHLSEQEIDEIRSVLSDTGLVVANVNAFMHHADGDTYHPSWIEKDPSLRAKRLDYTLRCIDLAEKLGASNISTEPGGPLQDSSREEGLELFLEGLKKVEQRALDKGVRVLIEPEPGLLIENSAQFLELFQHLDANAFGLNFDVGHFYCVGEDPVALIKELKDYT